MKNKLLFFLLVGVLMILSLPSTVRASQPIHVNLNGEQLQFDVPPVIENGRVLVPLRVIAEALGAAVSWDAASGLIIAAKSSTQGAFSVNLVSGNKVAISNSIEVELDVPPKVVNGRTLVPVRFVSEAFGAEVNWNAKEKIVTINTITNKDTRENIWHEGIPFDIKSWIHHRNVVVKFLMYWDERNPEAHRFLTKDYDSDVLDMQPNRIFPESGDYANIVGYQFIDMKLEDHQDLNVSFRLRVRLLETEFRGYDFYSRDLDFILAFEEGKIKIKAIWNASDRVFMENYYFSPFPDLGFWGRGEDERRNPIEFFEKFLK